MASYGVKKKPAVWCACHEETSEPDPNKMAVENKSEPSLTFENIRRVTSRSCFCSYRTESVPEMPKLPDSLLQQFQEFQFCLQFTSVPLRTVCEKVVSIKNESDLATEWSAQPQHFPKHLRRSLNKDKWFYSCSTAGLAVQCVPASRSLPARGCVEVHVQIYADTWGVYCEQILFQVQGLEPLVIDVWVEAVGSPLQLALQPAPTDCDIPEPSIWFTQGGAGEERRQLRVRNISRVPVQIHSYPLIQRERDLVKRASPTALPFRVLIRFEDTTPPCRCSSRISVEEDELITSYSSSAATEMDSEDIGTDIILYLGPDYGSEYQDFYQVRPKCVEIAAGETTSLEVVRAERPPHGTCTVDLCPEPADCPSPSACPTADEMPPVARCVAPDECPTPAACRTPAICPASAGTLLIEMQPVISGGPGWRRASPGAMVVHLKDVARLGVLRVTPEVQRVRLCAAELPDEPVRVRKRVRVENVGSGPLNIRACCEPPWTLVAPNRSRFTAVAKRTQAADLHLPPRSIVEVCLELTARAEDVVPLQIPYHPQLVLHKPLSFMQDQSLLQSVWLELDLEYTILDIEPRVLDFGFCTVGDTRKEYFTVTHSSKKAVLDIVTQWCGGDEFSLYPPRLRLAPGQREVVYVQFVPSRVEAPAEGRACLRAARASWCAASISICGRASHDTKFRTPARNTDYTDDIVLMPAKPKLHY